MIHHPTADIYLDDNNHVWFKFKKNARITQEHAYEYIDILDEICGGQKRCIILDTRNTRASVTQENRWVMGNDQRALKWRKADAMLVDSLHIRMIANFYMKFDTPTHPVKLFGTEEEAKEWLKQF